MSSSSIFKRSLALLLICVRLSVADLSIAAELEMQPTCEESLLLIQHSMDHFTPRDDNLGTKRLSIPSLGSITEIISGGLSSVQSGLYSALMSSTDAVQSVLDYLDSLSGAFEVWVNKEVENIQEAVLQMPEVENAIVQAAATNLSGDNTTETVNVSNVTRTFNANVSQTVGIIAQDAVLGLFLEKTMETFHALTSQWAQISTAVSNSLDVVKSALSSINVASGIADATSRVEGLIDQTEYAVGDFSTLLKEGVDHLETALGHLNKTLASVSFAPFQSRETIEVDVDAAVDELKTALTKMMTAQEALQPLSTAYGGVMHTVSNVITGAAGALPLENRANVTFAANQLTGTVQKTVSALLGSVERLISNFAAGAQTATPGINITEISESAAQAAALLPGMASWIPNQSAASTQYGVARVAVALAALVASFHMAV